MTALKVTGNQINEALIGLRYITGINDEKDGNRKARFSFKPAIKIVLSKRLKQLNELSKDLDDHRKELMGQHGLKGIVDTDGNNTESPEALADFAKEWTDYLSAEQELDIGLIEEDSLNLEANDIAAGFLSAIEWLVKWKDTPAEPAKA